MKGSRVDVVEPNVLARWRRDEGDYGWPAHFVDVFEDGRVAVWSRMNPRDEGGVTCTYAEFLAGEHERLAVQNVGQAAYEDVLAYVRDLPDP